MRGNIFPTWNLAFDPCIAMTSWQGAFVGRHTPAHILIISYIVSEYCSKGHAIGKVRIWHSMGLFFLHIERTRINRKSTRRINFDE